MLLYIVPQRLIPLPRFDETNELSRPVAEKNHSSQQRPPVKALHVKSGSLGVHAGNQLWKKRASHILSINAIE